MTTFKTLFPVLAFVCILSPISSFGDEHCQTHPLKIPDQYDHVWHEIDKHESGLERAIHENNRQQVHEHAFAVQDLARALPLKKTPLKPSQAEAAVRGVERAAVALDRASGAGNEKETRKQFDALQDAIDSLENELGRGKV